MSVVHAYSKSATSLIMTQKFISQIMICFSVLKSDQGITFVLAKWLFVSPKICVVVEVEKFVEHLSLNVMESMLCLTKAQKSPNGKNWSPQKFGSWLYKNTKNGQIREIISCFNPVFETLKTSSYLWLALM